MDKYEYISAENLQDRIVDLSYVSVEYVHKYFAENNYDVIYVKKGGKMYGVITPGDLLRYYLPYKYDSYINTKFSYIFECNFDLAEKIFIKHPSINEVPVVKDGILDGIIFNGKARPDESWSKIRLKLSWYTSECMEWAYSAIKKFLNKNRDIKVYLYASTTNYKNLFNSSQKKIIEQTKQRMEYKFQYPAWIQGFSQMSDNELKEFFNELYSKKRVEQFIEDMEKLDDVKKDTVNGVFKFSDLSSSIYNFKDGYRVTDNKPNDAKSKIWFLGGCVWLGAYVDDNHTIESYLQNMIGERTYEVINCGNMGRWTLDRLLTEKFSSTDIVVIFLHLYGESDAWLKCEKEFSNVILKTNLAEVFDIEDVEKNLFDHPYHCNHIINERIAKVIYNDIYDVISKKSDKKEYKREALQDYFIPWEMVYHYKNLFKKNNVKKFDNTLKKGAIVMSCSPFTKGHKYLIEQAAPQVDYLYILVVETDKSEFKFDDRLNMVKLGVQNLKNVIVLPAGKHLVSMESFSQYFTRQQVNEIKDTNYDMHIFAEAIAKPLDITCRFAGSEPLDRVTNSYNETMARILPAEEIEFIEIPRATTENNDVISASTVRRLIAEKQYEKLNDYLPETTINYIREHINHDI